MLEMRGGFPAVADACEHNKRLGKLADTEGFMEHKGRFACWISTLEV
jgi:hypothetical protein